MFYSFQKKKKLNLGTCFHVPCTKKKFKKKPQSYLDMGIRCLEDGLIWRAHNQLIKYLLASTVGNSSGHTGCPVRTTDSKWRFQWVWAKFTVTEAAAWRKVALVFSLLSAQDTNFQHRLYRLVTGPKNSFLTE